MIKCENQNNNDNNNHSGFTLMEVIVAILLLSIFVLAASGVLLDSQRGWNSMYDRTFSEVMTASHTAKRVFEATVRKSSVSELSIDTSGKWVEVHYYDDDTSTFLDCYARFYYSGTKLYVERGWLNPSNPSNPRGILSTSIVCENVSNCIFKRSGKYVYMMITLNDGSHSIVVGSSAILHNS